MRGDEAAMRNKVCLREVQPEDLPIFFEHQLEPEAIQMAAFPSRERHAFLEHWRKTMADENVILRTLLFDKQIAGNVVSFEVEGKREVGYWLGKEYWGRGIASAALAEFVKIIEWRPLYAEVAAHNLGSQRVLEKCGFTRQAEPKSAPGVDAESVEIYSYILAQ